MLFVHNPSLHALIKEKENFDNSGSSVLGDTNRYVYSEISGKNI